ncbi:MAG: ISNCY family transposase [Firmicutes bacterium]|nr:ISNCY family transposase [Bacillota bacterium]
MLVRDSRKYAQGQLWMPFLPEELFRPDPELQKIAAILDDPKTLEPFVERYLKAAAEANLKNGGRPTVPLRTFAAMVLLKFMYDLPYRELCNQVKDRISWRIFCHIPITAKVPDYSTICKLVHRFGPEAVEEMNKAVLRHLAGKKKLKTKKLKVDTTVIESDIAYPTDTGLLSRGIRKIGRLVKKLHAKGLAKVESFVDHSRKAQRLLRETTRTLRERAGEAGARLKTVLVGLATLAEDTVCQVGEVLRRVEESLAQGGRSVKESLLGELVAFQETLGRVTTQVWQRLAGGKIDDRVVSLFDREARPIVKGKAGKPVEFGYKTLVVTNEQGLVLHHEVYIGNPADEEVFVPAVLATQEKTGKVFAELAADRGMYSAENEAVLKGLGIRHVCIPKRGKKDEARRAYERQAWFRRLCRFRAACEAEISRLKRRYGLGRVRTRGHVRVKTWVGWGILAHNLVVAAGL